MHLSKATKLCTLNACCLLCQLYLSKNIKNTLEKCQKQLKSRKLRDELKNKSEEISRRTQNQKTIAKIYYLKMKYKSNKMIEKRMHSATGKSPSAPAVPGVIREKTGGREIQRTTRTSISAKFLWFYSLDIIYSTNYLLRV